MSGSIGDLLGGIGKGIGGLGSALGGVMSATGSQDAVAGFNTAADLATQDQQIALDSAKIQQVQQQRQITNTIGSQRAEVASAGFEESGSSLSLLASSAQQGAQTVALTGIQGQIQANGYAQQAAAYTAQAKSAQDAAKAQTAGGFLSGLGSAVSLGASIASFF